MASLERPEVGEALRERRGLCYPHLRYLIAGLSPAQAAIVADAVRAAIDRDGLTAAAGTDPDTEHRSRWYPLVAEHTEPAGLPEERLAADLGAGSCPCCRRVGRAEATYLAWLLEQEQPSRHDLQLCPRHLRDTAQLGGESAPTVRARCGVLKARVDDLAMAAQRQVRERRARRRLRRLTSDDLDDRYQRAVGNLEADYVCRACRSAASAAERCLALIAACADDRHVRAALDRGHGLCLRHGERAAGAGWAEPFVRRLLTRLRQSAWELNEDMLEQAWDLRHEPVGRKASVWRRVPTLLDGRTYLGLAEADLR